MCDCRDSSTTITDSWASDLLPRVPSPLLEDLRVGRIYASDPDVIDVDDRDDVHDMAAARWEGEHVAAIMALARISEARSRVRAAEQDLDSAVQDARAAGETWESIGHATGITRQTDHSRWGQG